MQPNGAPPISVVVADAYPLYVQGATAALNAQPDIALLGTAADLPDALGLITHELPQVAVIDIDLPGHDGSDIVRVLHERSVPTRIIMVAEHWLGESVLEYLTAGAAGFISKTISGPELIAAIRQVAAGQSVLPDGVTQILADTIRQHADGPLALSAREREILNAMSQGQSAASIAVKLDLAVPTVKSHISNLYAKLGVHDRGSAVGAAIRRGVIK
jgi:two-component system nitrate/nitrite response regulator NarL